MKSFELAFRDLGHDKIHFLCAIILIAAMTGPFLVLLGIKIGTVTVLMSELRDSPENLEISISGAHVFDTADVEAVRGIPGVAFAEGQNLFSVTGRVALRAPNGDQAISGSYGVTGQGDPMTATGSNLPDDQLILSSALARRLDVTVGDAVLMDLERGEPFPDAFNPEFRVREILGPKQIVGNFILLTSRALFNIESYGLGFAVPELGVELGKPLSQRNDSFEKIRTYAADVEDLPALVLRIEEKLGVQTNSRDSDVAVILQLERNLGAALGFVSAAGLVGLFFVLLAHFWNAVRRKRLNWSLLSLMGVPPVALGSIPVIQAVLVSACGFVGGVLVYAVIGGLIDFWFRPFLQEAESISTLPLWQAGLVGLCIVLVSTVASAASGYVVMRSDPAEIIRKS